MYVKHFPPVFGEFTPPSPYGRFNEGNIDDYIAAELQKADIYGLCLVIGLSCKTDVCINNLLAGKIKTCSFLELYLNEPGRFDD